MTINGIFFDLYGTLLVYGNMDVAWSDWLNALHEQLRLRGLSLSIESLAKTCDQFFGKSEPTPRQHDLTVFEQRIQNLCFDLELNLAAEDIKTIANRVATAWQKHISLDSEAHDVLHTLHRSKKLALVSNFDHPPHVHSVLSELSLTPYFDAVVISAEVGIKKPDPRIFDTALEQTGSQWYPQPEGWGLCFVATAVFSKSRPSECRSTLGGQARPFDIDSSIYIPIVV